MLPKPKYGTENKTKTCFRSPRLVCPELCRSKTEFNVCLSSQDVVLHCQSWHTDLMCTAWEWKLLWKSFSDFKRTARPACSENIVRRKLNTLTDGIDVPCFFRKKNAHVKRGGEERERERHLPWIHMARVSSRVSNSLCKQFLVGGWHSEGSCGLSL